MRLFFRICAFVLLFFGQAVDVLGQSQSLSHKQLIFDQLPSHLGLSQRSINCMYQDAEGFLWVGTWSGLIRYDGYETITYLADNESEGKLKSNKVTSILEDKNGYLWIGTRIGGLFRFDKQSDEFIQFRHDSSNPKSLSNDNVWSIAEQKDGTLWVGTENGLNRFDTTTGEFQAFNETDGLSYKFVTEVYLDKSERLWAATENGLNLVEDKGGEVSIQAYRYTEDAENSALHNYIYKLESVWEEGKEMIYLVSKRGLKRWDGEKFDNYMLTDQDFSFSFFRTLKIIEAEAPFIIVGSENGLNVFDIGTKAFTGFFGNNDQRVNLSHNTVVDVFIDRTQVLWVGTKKGLNHFDTYDKGFELFGTLSFDKTQSTLTGIRGDGQNIWLSTMGGGLFLFDRKNEAFREYNIPNSRGNNLNEFVQKLFLDSKGIIWLGTAGAGVIKVDPNDPANRLGTVRKYRQYSKSSPAQISDDYIMSLEESADGGMWIGTWSGGLNKITKEGKTLKIKSDLLNSIPIVALYEDESGKLWVGTRGKGLYLLKIEGEEIQNELAYTYLPEQSPISNDFITTIHKDDSGVLWVGTEDGLNYFDARSRAFEIHKEVDGEKLNQISGLLSDDAGNLWVANIEGVKVIRPDKEGLSLLSSFDIEDRLQGGFFYNDVAYRDKDGSMIFGGTDGFNILNPKNLTRNPHIPKMILKGFTVFNQSLIKGEKLNGRQVMEQQEGETHVTLRHFENSISFEFAALHFAAPQKNKLAYKLDGLDENWRTANADRGFHNYTNLKDGDYVFKVKGSNNDGLWSEEISTIYVTILPPWWRTNLALFGFIVAIALILYAFRRLIIIRTNFINNLKFERMERESLESLNKAKLQFFTNISHEFRTPLTLILGPLERLLHSGEGGKFVKEQLVTINQNTQRLLRLVNQLLDFRKAESGAIELEVAEGNIVKFVKEIKLSFDALAQEKNIDFQLLSSSNVIQLWYDRDQFEKILFNLLSNAFKHTDAGGKVTLKVHEHDSEVSFVVEDNGKGIRAENFEKIFERFYSGEEGYTPGTGIGLALTKSLVEMHSGSIRVESVENEYARFIFKIPKGNAHFDESVLRPEFKNSEYIGNYQVELPKADVQKEPILPARDISEMEKLLIVEDNAEVRAHVKSLFKNEYIVLEAQNGKEGLEIAKEEVPDVIVSDVMMPVMDGINLCKQLKKGVNTSHIPVILLTARTSHIFQVEGLEHGADDYLTKPFNGQILMLKVQNLIKARKNLQSIYSDKGVVNIEPKKVTLTSSDEKFIADALESIERNMSNQEYNVEEFGRDIGLSRMQLYRKLKAMTGLSANEFIRNIRLKRAAQLLEQNELTISEVAYEVGFTDRQYFRTCFKKQFGVNPSKYVKAEEKPTMEES